jgi:cell division cycle protein 20 (cofactor of APC complex)
MQYVWKHSNNILSFMPAKPCHDSSLTSVTPVKNIHRAHFSKRDRPRDPYRSLDVPGFIDDFYLSLLAWSSDNIVAVAMESAVYLGNLTTDVVTCLCEINDYYYISSVKWVTSRFLAVGVSYGKIRLYDVTTRACVRNMACHTKRVSSLNWCATNHLASGGRDGVMIQHDLRLRHHIVSKVQAHSHEACQVSWSPDGKMLASGGNDDIVRIWDVTKWASPRFTFSEHKAAVKAIAWNPHDYSMIVTGGGATDKTIKFWNARVGITKKSVNTSAQVCSLLWNPHHQELLSGHGYGGNKLSSGLSPSVACIQEFPLRSDVRPLNMSLCPEGSEVCVATSDETIKFWRMFTPFHKKTTDELSLPESYAKSFGEPLPMSDAFWAGHQVR